MKYAGYCLAAWLFADAAIPGPAAANTAARTAAWAKLPNWTGLWELRTGPPPGAGGQAPGAPPGAESGALRRGPPSGDDMDYTPAWKAVWTARKAANARIGGDDQLPDTTVTRCIWGFPRLFMGPYLFEATVTPEEVMLNYDPRDVRHIYTDGRALPALKGLAPAFAGYSVGRWQGDTLVVHTLGMVSGTWVTSDGATLSPAATGLERWRMTTPDTLHVEVTITDPHALAGPWRFSRDLSRVKDTNRLVHQNCFENTREVPNAAGGLTTRFTPAAP